MIRVHAFKRLNRPPVLVGLVSLAGLAGMLGLAFGPIAAIAQVQVEGGQGGPSPMSPMEPGSTTTFSDLLNASAASAGPKVERITPVREAALRETAQLLGMQWGLGDRSREIVKQIEADSTALDRRFGFGQLMMGVGFLPPVISEARDAVAIEGSSMRVAKRIYRIDEPPRPVAVAPSWRDWLYLGLDPKLQPRMPTETALLPQSDREKAYWQQELKRNYAEGRKQADDVFNLNLARLQRTYDGMRRFYDLYRRGMVTAPVIAEASSIIDHDDPNTVVVGGAVFRITANAKFVDQTDKWVPLAN